MSGEERVHPAARRADLRRPADLVATAFGLGLSPVAPGSVASLAALPFAWWIVGAGGAAGLGVAAAAVFVIGVWAADAMERRLRDHDPGHIVIDEVAGQWLALTAAPRDLVWFAAGFVLFRILDIVKPWPVSWADRRVGGGLGVMLDDMLAGACAAAALLAARILAEVLSP